MSETFTYNIFISCSINGRVVHFLYPGDMITLLVSTNACSASMTTIRKKRSERTRLERFVDVCHCAQRSLASQLASVDKGEGDLWAKYM